MKNTSKNLSLFFSGRGFIGLLFWLLLVCLGVTGLQAAESPRRQAFMVKDVFAANTVDWFISPAEEPEGDFGWELPEECDIKGALATQDQEYLRLDLIMYNPVSTEVSFVEWNEFGFNLTMSGKNWDYMYTPSLDQFQRFFYTKPKNEITEFEKGKTKHLAGIADNKKAVYFILNKAEFTGGQKGKQSAQIFFFAGNALVKNGDFSTVEADRTITITLEYDN
jgi:hypothetical protein